MLPIRLSLTMCLLALSLCSLRFWKLFINKAVTPNIHKVAMIKTNVSLMILLCCECQRRYFSHIFYIMECQSFQVFALDFFYVFSIGFRKDYFAYLCPLGGKDFLFYTSYGKHCATKGYFSGHCHV